MIFLLLLAFFLERVFQCIWNIAAFRYCLLFSLLYLPTEQVYHSKQYSNFFCSRILDDLLVVFPLLISVHLYQCLHSFSVEYFFSASFFANMYRLLDFFFFFFFEVKSKSWRKSVCSKKCIRFLTKWIWTWSNPALKDVYWGKIPLNMENWHMKIRFNETSGARCISA